MAAVEVVPIAPPPDAGDHPAVAPVAAVATGATVADRPSPGAGAGNESVDPAIFACHTDSDCTAVRKNGCCNHGEMEAVNASQAAAYKASFTCKTHQMCPQFLRRDLRVPVCDGAASRCQMVQPKP